MGTVIYSFVGKRQDQLYAEKLEKWYEEAKEYREIYSYKTRIHEMPKQERKNQYLESYDWTEKD
jgi:hypothetical protein